LLCASSERNEFEQTSSASPCVLWASVMRCGRISCTITGTPAWAICHAASEPARPPPMTWTGGMLRDVFIPRRCARALAASRLSYCFEGGAPEAVPAARRARPSCRETTVMLPSNDHFFDHAYGSRIRAREAADVPQHCEPHVTRRTGWGFSLLVLRSKARQFERADNWA